jgi:putative autotransporter adhesin-like protein
MTTLTKFIVGLVVSFMLMSCQFNTNFGIGVRGNGNVETLERHINEDFNEIKVSRGLDVYLTQGDNISVRVQADENLHDIIMTEVENNVLRIYADENINYAASKKVMVSFKDINKISSSSGSDVYSTNTITAESLELSTSSGSDMELEVDTHVIECNSSSGSDLRLSGKTDKLYAEASSGSDIKAGNLKTTFCEAKASSGADITVNTSQELYAKASSGGDIKYYGNPEKISKKDGVSGSIRKQ